VKEPDDLCYRIFNNLKRAKGLSTNDLPKLTVVAKIPQEAGSERILSLASANSATGEIYLERRTANLSLSKLGDDGENGIAFILAHEIAHYINRHKVKHEYVVSGAVELKSITAIPDNSLDQITAEYNAIARKYQIRANESEADLEAGFICYLAGYHSKTAGAKLLAEAYKTFPIPDPDNGNYPKLAERQEITKRASNKLDTLVHVYDMANYLNFVGEYEMSSVCYEYISKTFQSKEILNNKGILYLQQAIELMDPENIRYVLPISLDLNFLKGKGFDEVEKQKFNKKIDFLTLAIQNFDDAIKMDPDYTIAHLNKSIAHYLVNIAKKEHPTLKVNYRNDDLAQSQVSAFLGRQAGEKDSLNNAVSLSNIYTQLAILNDYNKGNLDETNKYFDKAMFFSKGNIYLKANKLFIEKAGTDYAKLNSQLGHGTMCNESIKVYNTLSLEDIREKIKIGDKWTFGLLLKSVTKTFSKKTYYFQFADNDEFKFYNFMAGYGAEAETDILMFEPKASYTHNAICDLKKGSDLITIDKLNNVDHRTISTNTGFLVDFKQKDSKKLGLIFKITNNEVDNWIVYDLNF
jgi:hypothetical protein